MTELIQHLSLGFSVALSLQNLMYCFIGCFLGTLIGVLPGIGPVATIANSTITNAESATMPGGRINGNNTPGATNPTDLTVAEVKSILALTAADIAGMPADFCIALSDETTAITAGTAKVTWRAPYAFTIDSVRASLNTASTSGILTVDINENGTSILGTELTIDEGARTSVTATNPAVISNRAVTDDAEITMDVDASGTGAKGLKVWILGHK